MATVMGDQQPLSGDERPPRTTYKFTLEEMQVMARCNRESFYQRSLPISTILGLGTYWCVKSGYLKPSPQWGAALKVTGAAIVGYFIGKLSYQQRCAEYFMALPNSHVGEILRKRRNERLGGGTANQDGGVESSFGVPSLPSFGGFPSDDVYSDMSDGHRYTDLDTDRPLNEGLNDSYRPSVDYPALEEELFPPTAPGSTTTYEELRRKNREEYATKRAKPYGTPPPSDELPNQYPRSTLTPPPQSTDDQRFSSPNSKQKNAYGDVWEK